MRMKIGTAWRERMGDWASCNVGATEPYAKEVAMCWTSVEMSRKQACWASSHWARFGLAKWPDLGRKFGNWAWTNGPYPGTIGLKF